MGQETSGEGGVMLTVRCKMHDGDETLVHGYDQGKLGTHGDDRHVTVFRQIRPMRAIEAMREPTEDMAGRIDDVFVISDCATHRRTTWQQMIDIALEEK